MLGVIASGASVVVGALSGAGTAIVVVGATMAAAGLVRPSLTRWMPQRVCQVANTEVNRRGFSGAAWRWGFELGTGVSTLVVTSAFYLFLALAVSQPQWFVALFMGAVYGVTRGVTIAAFAAYQGLVQARDPRVGGSIGRTRKLLQLPLLLTVIAVTGAYLVEGWPA